MIRPKTNKDRVLRALDDKSAQYMTVGEISDMVKRPEPSVRRALALLHKEEQVYWMPYRNNPSEKRKKWWRLHVGARPSR